MHFAQLVLIVAAFVAGAQNALAGGGSFLTFPALLYNGLDPRAANITSAMPRCMTLAASLTAIMLEISPS